MSKVSEPAYCICQIAIDLLSGKAISADSAHGIWLKEGIVKYMLDDNNISLDKTLGLAVCGSRHASTQLATRVRNHYLVLAINHISLDDEVSNWERYVRLAAQIRKLITFWEAQRINVSNQKWESWKIYLHQAWLIGLGVPETPNGLKNVKENSTYSLHNDELIMYEIIKGKAHHESLVFNQRKE